MIGTAIRERLGRLDEPVDLDEALSALVDEVLTSTRAKAPCEPAQRLTAEWGPFAAEVIIHLDLEAITEAGEWRSRSGQRVSELVRTGEFRLDHLLRRWAVEQHDLDDLWVQYIASAVAEIERHHPTYMSAVFDRFGTEWIPRAATLADRGWSDDHAARLAWMGCNPDLCDINQLAARLQPWEPPLSHPDEPEPSVEQRVFALIDADYPRTIDPSISVEDWAQRRDTVRDVLSLNDMRSIRSEGIARGLRPA